MTFRAGSLEWDENTIDTRQMQLPTTTKSPQESRTTESGIPSKMLPQPNTAKTTPIVPKKSPLSTPRSLSSFGVSSVAWGSSVPERGVKRSSCGCVGDIFLVPSSFSRFGMGSTIPRTDPATLTAIRGCGQYLRMMGKNCPRKNLQCRLSPAVDQDKHEQQTANRTRPRWQGFPQIDLDGASGNG